MWDLRISKIEFNISQTYTLNGPFTLRFSETKVVLPREIYDSYIVKLMASFGCPKLGESYQCNKISSDEYDNSPALSLGFEGNSMNIKFAYFVSNEYTKD